MAASRARRPIAAAYNVDGGAAGVTQCIASLGLLMGGAVSCPCRLALAYDLVLNKVRIGCRVEQQPVGCILLREGVC